MKRCVSHTPALPLRLFTEYFLNVGNYRDCLGNFNPGVFTRQPAPTLHEKQVKIACLNDLIDRTQRGLSSMLQERTRLLADLPASSPAHEEIKKES